MNSTLLCQPELLQFDNISNEDGISQSSIFSVVKDHTGIMWFGTADGLNRYDGYDFIVYKNNPADSSSLSSKVVVEVFEDSRNNLWVGTLGGGLNLFNRDSESFKIFTNDPENPNSISGNDVRVIIENKSGELLIGTNDGINIFDIDKEKFENIKIDDNQKLFNYVWSIKKINDSQFFVGTYGGLYKLDLDSKKVVKHYSRSESSNSLLHNYSWSIFSEGDSVLWIGSYLGLSKLNIKNENIERIIPDNSAEPGTINNIFAVGEYDKNTLLLGTRGGLLFFDKKTFDYRHYIHSVFSRSSLSNDRIYEIYKDDTGIIWIGTDIGISKYDKSRNKFNTYDVTTQINGTSLSNGQVYDFAVKKGYGTWIATANGISFFDEKEQKFKTLKHTSNIHSISNNYVRALHLKDENELWIGTANGLNRMNIETGRFMHYFSDAEDSASILSKRINCLYTDSKNRLWIGSARGVSRFNSVNGHFINYETNNLVNQSYNYVSSIVEDNKGNIIFGTYGDGLKIIDEQTKTISSFVTDSDSLNNLKDNYILSLSKTKGGSIWVGTNNGFNKFDPEKKNFPEYHLAGDAVLGMISISETEFWISTNNGLVFFNTETNVYRRFNNTGEVQGLQYQAGAYYEDENGKLYFGGINGYNSFYPDKVSINEIPPNVIISEVLVDGELLELPKGIDPEKGGDIIPNIYMEYDKKLITVKVSVLHYTSPNNNKCSYYLKGSDKKWTDIGTRRHIVYTDLSPGKYTLVAKGSNSDGIWSDEIELLRLEVETPPYRTVWAFLVYFLFASGFIYGLIKYNNRQKEKEIAALKRADKLKTEFLAQMSHEIRTPINTILNFVSLVKTDIGSKIGKSLTEYFKIIDHAGERIVRTINLILDMSQFQTGTYEAIYREFDLVKDVLSNMYNEFKMKAEEKGLKLQLELNCSRSNITADEYTVNQIFQNLIDNAIKYTISGSVKIKAINNEKDHILVTVTDTGIGMTEDFLPKIFSPFSQEEQGYTRKFDGNGLGLALVKNYCDLNKIEISVKSEKNKGTTFSLLFHNS